MSQLSLFNQYLDTDCSSARQKLLIEILQSGSRLPFGIVRDLLNYDLAHGEHALLLKLAELPANDRFERFLTEGYFVWDQSVVSAAVSVWAEKTQHNYWQIASFLAGSSEISQRISYTLADCAWHGDGASILKALSSQPNLENMATTYYNLLLTRCLQWQLRVPQLAAVAKAICEQALFTEGGIETGALLPALCYHRYAGGNLPVHRVGVKLTEIWRGYVGFLDHSFAQTTITSAKQQLLAAVKGEKGLNETLALWLHCQQRHSLSADDVVTLYRYLERLPQPIAHWQMFSGIESHTLVSALDRLPVESQVGFVDAVGSLMACPAVFDWLQAQPAEQRSKFAPRWSSGQYNTAAKDPSGFYGCQPSLRLVDEASPRSDFFAKAYGGNTSVAANPAPSGPADYWQLLHDLWQNPEPKQLAKLGELARQQPRVWQLAYIDTLGQFTGNDQAVLKLLDYIRSSDQKVLAKVIGALHKIATPRAVQEMIHFLTRSNVSFAIRMDIIALLADSDVSLLQKELRSALVDVTHHARLSQDSLDLQEALSGLLTTEDQVKLSKVLAEPQSEGQEVTTEQLDRLLKDQLGRYGDLPSECKRAFRTALFFDQQVSQSKHLTTIDLSPAIDMQYKALELLFRDVLEESALRLIQSGILQRKLDVIGYARPIPAAMEEFETYIAGLPIVADIQFFSRFKLRKMLRAICQYRKGKRFTLDGLKAFGLFLLCFSRKSCRYQMADIYHLEGFSDEKLFMFCKRLHEFQDFRNRAAHEGFHPGKSSNLDQIWEETALIVAELFAIDVRQLAARTANNSAA